MKFQGILIFLLGFLSCFLVVSLFSYSDLEVPFGTGLVGLEVNAPSDWVSEEDIIVFDDRVVLNVGNVSLSSYAGTGSMKPVFDEGANGIRVVPSNESEIGVGDIVSYRFGGVLFVHRVVGKGVDGDGVYFVVQGDNNLVSDGKIRFEQIEYVTIGVLY